MGKSAGIAAQGACEDAYNTYQAYSNVNNKDDYIKGCVAAVMAKPVKKTTQDLYPLNPPGR